MSQTNIQLLLLYSLKWYRNTNMQPFDVIDAFYLPHKPIFLFQRLIEPERFSHYQKLRTESQECSNYVIGVVELLFPENNLLLWVLPPTYQSWCPVPSTYFSVSACGQYQRYLRLIFILFGPRSICDLVSPPEIFPSPIYGSCGSIVLMNVIMNELHGLMFSFFSTVQLLTLQIAACVSHSIPIFVLDQDYSVVYIANEFCPDILFQLVLPILIVYHCP